MAAENEAKSTEIPSSNEFPFFGCMDYDGSNGDSLPWSPDFWEPFRGEVGVLIMNQEDKQSHCH